MELPVIKHAQFVQHDKTSIDLNVVAPSGASDDIRAAMVAEVRSIMGPDVEVRLHFVRDIPRNPRSGKYQSVICTIPARNAAHAVSICS